MTTRIAFAGTAGRNEDGERLTKDVWNGMVDHARRLLDAALERDGLSRDDVTLVSGGAAYADHLAVKLYREGRAGNLELHLPADLDEDGFRPNRPGDRRDPANVINHYHRRFEERTGEDGLGDIRSAVRAGASVEITPGFKERNTRVAESADQLIAYTFGDRERPVALGPSDRGHTDPYEAGVKDGGTGDTWRKATDASRKINVPIGMIERNVERAGGRINKYAGTNRGDDQAEHDQAERIQQRRQRGEPVIESGMYFNYEGGGRDDVTSSNTFEAVLAGERTSTTRMAHWRGAAAWRHVRPGDTVRFHEDRERAGRAVDVTVSDVRQINLSAQSEDDLEDWSRAEGWSASKARELARSKERTEQAGGKDVQILFETPSRDAIIEPEHRSSGRSAGGSAERTAETSAEGTDTGGSFHAPNAIREFKGHNRFLSNFVPAEVQLDGVTYPTVEHAYQAAKTEDPAQREKIRKAERPGEAKKLGRHIDVRSDWEDVKDHVMADLVAQKFSQEPHRSNLLATGDAPLFEGNTWGDRHFGVDARTGEGENVLGRFLMRVRERQRQLEMNGSATEAEGDAGTDPESERGRLQYAASAAANMLAAYDGDDTLKRNVAADPRLRGVQQAMVDLTATAEENALAEARPDDMEEGALENVAADALRAVEEISENGIAQRLAAAGGHDVVAGAASTEDQLRRLGYTVPESAEVRRVAENAPGSVAAPAGREQFEAVAESSLDMLERVHAAGGHLDDIPRARELAEALDEADYLLPGENPERTAPLSEQAHRGDDEQLAAVATSAAAVVNEATPESLESARFDNAPGGMRSLAVAQIGGAVENIAERLESAGIPTDERADLSPAIITTRMRDHRFAYVDRRTFPEAEEAGSEEAARDIVISAMEAEPSRYAHGVRFADVSGRTDTEAVEAFRNHVAERDGTRENALLVSTDDTDLPPSRVDEIERALDEGRDPEAPAPSRMRGRNALDPAKASALADVVDAAGAVVDNAQFDTASPDRVMYPDAAWRAADAALSRSIETGVPGVLSALSNGESTAPGLSPENAQSLRTLHGRLQDVVSTSDEIDDGGGSVPGEEGNNKRRVVEMREADALVSASHHAAAGGATVAVSALAGREETLRAEDMPEGQGLAGYANLREALSAGQMPNPETHLQSQPKLRPEMSQAYWDNLNLSPTERQKANPFIMKPGRGLFEGYDSPNAAGDGIPQMRQNKLRNFIRKNLDREDGHPNHAFRGALMNLAFEQAEKDREKGYETLDPRVGRKTNGRAIVAPHVDEAKVIREEAERLNMEHETKLAAQDRKWSERAPKEAIPFNASEVRRTARKLEASGSPNGALMIKRDDRISLEHNEAPLARSERIPEDSHLADLPDGYRMSRIPASALAKGARTAGDDGHGHVHVRVEADRPTHVGDLELDGDRRRDREAPSRRRRAARSGERREAEAGM